MQMLLKFRNALLHPSRTLLNQVLYWILSLQTFVYLSILILGFHHINGILLSNGFTFVYAVTLTLYTIDKEICKGEQPTDDGRAGQWFVYLWIVLVAYVHAWASIKPDVYVVPDYLVTVFVQVVTLFGVTQNRDKLREFIQKWAGPR